MSNSTNSSAASFEDSIGETINSYINLSVLLLFSASLLLLCTIFRNHQPLKSRANLPILGCCCLVVISLYSLLLNLLKHLGVVHGSTNVWMTGVGFSLTGVGASLNLLQAVQAIRFLLLQNANFQRLKFVKASSATTSRQSIIQPKETSSNGLVLRKIAMYRILLSPYIPPVLLMVAVVVLVPMHALGYYYDVTNSNKAQPGKVIVSISSYASIYMVLLIVCIIDLVQNIRSVCPLHQYLIKRDRLMFRIEALFGVFTVTFYALVMSLRGSLGGVISRGGTGALVVLAIVDIMRQVFLAIYVGAGIPLIVVLVSRIRQHQQDRKRSRASARRKSLTHKQQASVTATTIVAPAAAEEDISNLDLMSTLLNDNLGLKLFEEYVHSEYSIENLECWKVIQQLKAECATAAGGITTPASSQAQRKLLKQIHETFVQSRSPLQVNITAEIRTEFEAMLQEMQQATPVTPSPATTSLAPLHARSSSHLSASAVKDLSSAAETTALHWGVDMKRLKNFEGSILMNLSDSFMRLKQTAEYFQFLKGVEAKKNMLHALNFS